jgi:hypothetical protein
MITCEVRASYANVWEPKPDLSGRLRYSISLLIPKSNEAGVNEIKQVIQEAIQNGISKGKFKQTDVPRLKLPLRDGDEEVGRGAYDSTYKGFYFMNCSNDRAPGIVDNKVQPIMDQDEFYSGCWCRADIQFFPFAVSGNKGVGVSLQNLMKTRDDERLDGKLKAEEAFASFKPESELLF